MNFLNGLVGAVLSFGKLLAWFVVFLLGIGWALGGNPSFLIFMIVFFVAMFCAKIYASKEKESK